jgi:K+-transporting ATPase ATPase A chain
VFGGVGVGFINMLIFIIVAVFVAGMMIGRTPEFLGKKVEAKEMKLASLAMLWHPLAILIPEG